MIDKSLVFDASSILLLVRELGKEALDILSEGSTILLAFYEVGNAIWKEHFLLKRLGEGDAKIILTAVFAMLGKMKIVRLEEEKSGVSVFEFASNLGVTYYDACYLVAAQKTGGILITEDKKLTKAAEKIGVKVEGTRKFIKG